MNGTSEAPRLVYPPGAKKQEKLAMLKEWSPRMEAWRLSQCKKAGAEWMEWLSSQDDRMCEFCREMDGKVFPIDEFDVVALMHRCTNPDGCRCVCGPCDDPNEAQP